MKKVHLYEVKLIDGTFHRGEIVYKDDKTIRLKSPDKKVILLSKNGIMLIKDLGWRNIRLK
ncbi:hypothetical protein GQ543_01780 [candidate division WOR-3 bacterium]|nr:hypothetical protein [candidate division WOR-3 bacterium]